MGSDAEVAEDVLWTTVLPIINVARASRVWLGWRSAKLRKLESLPLMKPITPSGTILFLITSFETLPPSLFLIDL